MTNRPPDGRTKPRVALPDLPPLAHPWCVSEASPLLEIAWPPKSDAAAVKEYLDAVGAWIARARSPFAVLIDMTGFEVASSTALVHQVLVGSVKDIAADMTMHCVGLSTVTPSLVARGAVTAMLWLSPTPCPVKVHASTDGARSWLEERLARAAEPWRAR